MDANFISTIKEGFSQTLRELEGEELKAYNLANAHQAISGDEVDQTASAQAQEFFYRLKSRNNFYRKKIFSAIKKMEEG